MKFNKNLTAILFAMVFSIAFASVSFAQSTTKTDDAMKKDDGMKKDAMMKDDGMKKDAMMKDDAMMMEDKRPVVAVIAADWCPYCKNVDPVLKGVLADYTDKFNMVVFDVTNAKTSAAALATAEKLGLTEFFNANKSKTSTVAVIKNKEVVYRTSNNTKKSDYTKAFDKALQ